MHIVDFNKFFKVYWRVRKKWASQPQNFYWGDHVDGRYFMLFLLKDNIHKKKVLDVGVGTGIILSELSSDNMRVGIDIDHVAMAHAKRIDRDMFYIEANTFSLPFKAGVFDSIFLNSMLPLFSENEIEHLLFTLSDLLKPGGTVYISMANKDSFSYRGLKNALGFDKLRNLLAKHFNDIDARFFNPMPNFPFGPPNWFYNLFLCNKLTFALFFWFLTRSASKRGKWLIVSAAK